MLLLRKCNSKSKVKVLCDPTTNQLDELIRIQCAWRSLYTTLVKKVKIFSVSSSSVKMLLIRKSNTVVSFIIAKDVWCKRSARFSSCFREENVSCGNSENTIHWSEHAWKINKRGRLYTIVQYLIRYLTITEL